MSTKLCVCVCADLLHTAHSLEVDVIVFAGSERSVPVAPVRLVVSHCERRRFWKIPRRKLRRKVIRRSRAGGRLVGHRNLEALEGPGVSA